jgi:uncharacterized protein
MERMTKAATVTATTELGEFTAIAAAYSVDRVGDQIVKGAFEGTIGRWQQSGKRVPLHWDHKGDAHNIIGWIDPATMQEVDTGLQVSGKVDIDQSETAKEAWRSMKNGSMSLSFGYLVSKSQKRKDGITELREIDLFEISIVPVPANPDTRILSMKSADADRLETELQDVKARLEQLEKALEDQKTADETGKEPQVRSVDPLRRQADGVALEFATDGLPRKSPKRVEQPKPDLLPMKELKQRMRDEMLTHLSGETP